MINLRNLREERRLSLDKLSGEVGIPVPSLNAYEQGRVQRIPPARLEKLATYFAVEAGEIVRPLVDRASAFQESPLAYMISKEMTWRYHLLSTEILKKILTEYQAGLETASAKNQAEIWEEVSNLSRELARRAREGERESSAKAER